MKKLICSILTVVILTTSIPLHAYGNDDYNEEQGAGVTETSSLLSGDGLSAVDSTTEVFYTPPGDDYYTYHYTPVTDRTGLYAPDADEYAALFLQLTREQATIDRNSLDSSFSWNSTAGLFVSVG